MQVRPETPADRAAIRAVNIAAFETPAEADLVDALRGQVHPCVSLIADLDGEIVGHIMFSPVTLAGHDSLTIMGLAPMAVAPAHQRSGIGSALVGASLAACAELKAGAVVVLGHPAYYPRFGFRPASLRGIACPYDVPADAFMVLELVSGYLENLEGTIRYHAAFDSL